MHQNLMTLCFALIAGGFIFLCVLVIYLLSAFVAHLAQGHVPFRPFLYVSSVLILLCWLTMAYGYWVGRFRIDVRNTTYTDTRLPSAFEGYKIVHISDLHLGSFAGHPAALQRMVDSINAQQPDLICFTGDLVTFGVEEALPFTRILQQLQAKDTILSILGNHDLMIYRKLAEEERKTEVERLVAYERETLHWNLLRNDHIVITRPNSAHAQDTLAVLGVDNCSCQGQGFRTIYHGDLPRAMEGTEDCFRILLSHDPTHWDAEVIRMPNMPVTLSGHTHSGQMRIFGKPLASLLFREVAGWYYDTDRQHALYVNSGLGCTLPVRVNCPAEITVITLRAK